MSFNEILDILIVLVGTVGVVAIFFLYYTKPKVKNILDKLLPFIPLIFTYLASKTEDKKGIFDTHDTWKVLERVSIRIRETIQDVGNKDFSDVEDEVFHIVNGELETYRRSGVAGVPDITDQAVRAQIRVIFETIQRAFNEDTTRIN